MDLIFAVGIFILALSLVVLITLQPRQQQSLSTDATSNLGKPLILVYLYVACTGIAISESKKPSGMKDLLKDICSSLFLVSG